MIKRAFRAGGCLVVSLGIVLSSVTADAASDDIYIWRGGEIESGQDYSVRSEITVSEDLVIPENTTLYIRDGATLNISDGATLTVNGKIKINTGGLCRTWGDIVIAENAVLNIFGTMVVREDAVLGNSGLLAIYENGYINNMGTLSSDENAMISTDGLIYNRNGAALNIGSDLTVTSTGYIRNYGEMYIGEKSATVVYGKINLTDNAFIDISGTLSVEKGAVINGTGYITTEKISSIIKNGTISVEYKRPEIEYINGAAYVGGILLVNSDYPLPETYGATVNGEAYAALLRMIRDSGYPMTVELGFRSYERQEEIFTFWAAAYGEAIALTISTRQGESEHQSGLAFDMSDLGLDYAETDEGKWLAQNCHKYGFIIRYPENKEEYTGYSYDPQHIRYVGVETATDIYNSGLCLEEYLGVA